VDGNPVVKISAETPSSDSLFEIFSAARNHSNIDLFLATTDGSNFASF
jgi:hypothetical protein